MSYAETWTLTMYFLDATGKKEVENRLTFSSKDAAEVAIAAITSDPDLRTGKVFSIRNEIGESIEFRGQHWRRHTLKKDNAGLS